MARSIRRPRLQRLTAGILLGAFATSCLAFFLASSSVKHDNQLLLLRDTSQASLVLTPYLGELQPSVSGIGAAVGPGGVDQSAWRTAASTAATQIGASGLAVVRAVGGHLEVLARSGAVHEAFGSAEDATMASMLLEGKTPFDGFVRSGGQRWLVELLRLPDGYGLYAEVPYPKPEVFSLSSLPGHPFANLAAALYVGRESSSDLVFSTTRHLPLTGQRAVTVIPKSGQETSSHSVLSDRAGWVSSPGNIILVMTATSSLTGTASSLMPWILLVGLLAASVAVAVLFEVSGRRRLHQQRSDARFAAMVRSSSDLTTVVSADGTILYQNPSSTRLLGTAPEEMVGTKFSAHLLAGDLFQWHRELKSVQQAPGLSGRPSGGSARPAAAPCRSRAFSPTCSTTQQWPGSCSTAGM